MNTKKTISVIIPFLNEEQNIPAVYQALRSAWEEIPNHNYEFVFVNDGSQDFSAKAVEKLAAEDPQVKYIEFSRNFGKEYATTAGIYEATGDAVVMIDADLQHPPALIPKFVAQWEKGCEVVVGVRTANNGEGFVKRYGSKLFYGVMRAISETQIYPGETDFRLIDRAVVDAFKELPERHRMTRSLINWLGFSRCHIPFEAPARIHGEAKYTPSKLIKLAFNTFVSNSLLPLRLAGYLGAIITLGSLLLGTVVFVQRYILGDMFDWNVSGSGQLAIINVFLIGVVLMALGLIAMYVENIHVEVAGRPLYIVRKRLNAKK